MFTSQRLRSGEETGVGIDGGRAMIMMYPDSKVVVVMLSNILVDFGEAEAQDIGRFFLR